MTTSAGRATARKAAANQRASAARASTAATPSRTPAPDASQGAEETAPAVPGPDADPAASAPSTEAAGDGTPAVESDAPATGEAPAADGAAEKPAEAPAQDSPPAQRAAPLEPPVPNAPGPIVGGDLVEQTATVAAASVAMVSRGVHHKVVDFATNEVPDVEGLFTATTASGLVFECTKRLVQHTYVDGVVYTTQLVTHPGQEFTLTEARQVIAVIRAQAAAAAEPAPEGD